MIEHLEAMAALEGTRYVITAGVPVVLARLIVGLSYDRGEGPKAKFFTFVLPTFALFVLLSRITINFFWEGSVPADTWGATATWAFVVVAQFIATIYNWWPRRPKTILPAAGFTILLLGWAFAVWPYADRIAQGLP